MNCLRLPRCGAQLQAVLAYSSWQTRWCNGVACVRRRYRCKRKRYTCGCASCCSRKRDACVCMNNPVTASALLTGTRALHNYKRVRLQLQDLPETQGQRLQLCGLCTLVSTLLAVTAFCKTPFAEGDGVTMAIVRLAAHDALADGRRLVSAQGLAHLDAARSVHSALLRARSPHCALSTLRAHAPPHIRVVSGVRDGELSPLGTAACRCATAIACRPLRSRARAPRALARVTA